MGGTSALFGCLFTSSQKKSHTERAVTPRQCFSMMTSPVLAMMKSDWIIAPSAGSLSARPGSRAGSREGLSTRLWGLARDGEDDA